MRISAIAILFVLALDARGQYNWAAGALYYPGFLYAHTEDARNLEAHVQGFEISIARINNERRNWNRYYKNAEIGFNFLYMDLGRPQITGKVYALSTNFQFRVAGGIQNHLALRLGTGIGYLTEKFDFYQNRRNMAIGSHLNGEIQIALLYQTLIASRWFLKTGVGITHFSNGSVRVPNLGVNMPSLFLGLQYGFDKSSGKKADSANRQDFKRPRHEVLLNYAFKERFTAKPRNFHIVSAGYRRLWPLSPVRRWYLGTDLVWDPTHPYTHDLKNPNPRVAIDNSTELGILAGHRYDIGRFGLITDVGFYLLNPYQTKYFSYQRIGFRYDFGRNLFANMALKIHFGTADYFEWGLGYKFEKWRNK